MFKLSCLVLTGSLLAPSPAVAQSDVVTPSDNLVSDGLPPVPAAIALAARPYSEFRAAGFWDWHPMRREMIIGTRFGDAPQLHRVRSPGGDRTQLTFFPDPVSGASYQPTDGRYIVFTKDVGGAEFFQKYRYDVASGEITLLTDGKSRNVGGVWSHKGDRYAYMSTRRDGRDLDLWVMDPSDPRSDRMVVQLEGGGYGPADWSPDDRQVLLSQGLSVNESYLWLVDVASGQKTLLTPKEAESVAYGGAQFSRAGKGVYVTTDRGSEFQRLAYLDLATRRYRFLTSGIPWDVDEFDLSPDGRWIACVTNEDGVAVLHVIKAATGAERRIPKLPAGVISDVRWRKRGAELGFVFQTLRSKELIWPNVINNYLKGKAPERFEIQYCKIEGIRAELFERLIIALEIKQTEDRDIELLDLVKNLCLFVAQLPAYVRTTKRLSPAALAVRQAILEAREPAKLLFTDLPRACGFEPIEAQSGKEFTKPLPRAPNFQACCSWLNALGFGSQVAISRA